MKFLHVSDLHLGKMLHGVSLLENGDQPAWVADFLKLAEEQKPDAVLIAGDVYDRSAPSGDAVELLSVLMKGLASQRIPVLVVAGNHDSGQRLAFLDELLAREGVHIAGVPGPGGKLEKVTLRDAYGPVHFWLLPYVFPALAAKALGDESIRDYETAVRRILEAQDIDFSQRNVLVAHQNVTHAGAEAERGGSETMVGGLGQVDDSVFEGFSYVALGHIHAAGALGRREVRYAGSPLCYHFNEIKQPKKGAVLVELGAPGTEARIETLVIPPLHPLRELRGGWQELRDGELQRERRGEYLRVVLTDSRVTPEIGDYFRSLAQARDSRILELVSEYDPFTGQTGEARGQQEKSVEELFADFYAERCGGDDPSEKDLALLRFAGERLRHREHTEATEQQDVDALLQFVLEQEAEA
ncbi:MAG: exonuclease SbcCD subunit D [Oscillospiraceae bacterium]|nr:exonuclease SbcCD subunit D [Oscillospiraceae bacterium]